jgi:hypothetical protein
MPLNTCQLTAQMFPSDLWIQTTLNRPKPRNVVREKKAGSLRLIQRRICTEIERERAKG